MRSLAGGIATALDHVQPSRRPEPFGRLMSEVLSIPAFGDSVVVAGKAGLCRFVERLNVVGSPDPLPWLKPHELLLSTSYPLRELRDHLAGFVRQLDERGLSGLAVKSQPYLGDLPPEMLETADELGFPLIDVPEHVAFDEIISQALTGILNQQAETLVRAEEVHETILAIMLTGGGLEKIASQISCLIDGPAAILSARGEVLASATAEAASREFRSELFDQVGDNLAGDRGEVAGVPFVTLPIIVGGGLLGHLVAFEDGAPLRHDIKLVLEHAATLAALEMAKANELLAVEAKYQTNFVHDLLSGRTVSREEAVQRGKSFGWDLDRELVLYIVRADSGQGGTDDQLPTAAPSSGILAAARAVDPSCAVVELTAETVVVAGGHNRPMTPEEIRNLGRVVGQMSPCLSVGISRPVSDVLDLQTAYQQAHRALTVGRCFSRTEAVVAYDDLGAQRVLALVPDGSFLREFAAEKLGALAAPDDRLADLRLTLETLIETDCNVAETARRLHYHYNTVRYRVGRLQTLVGPFMDDARLKLDLHLALMILRMEDLWA